ncbi:WXG100 family type VII secretion target [Amycolatopsis sp. PS_44_ISF1]|uniref:WXG100 family type VII secretion target n=1 Tax=Amycolatopsis sp. PS_44_ISF1 TaxID=2974917 RepID=UPI0028DE253D|nr:WXG100 family type VII secretion target [Amycolatopsis sp. PS_44_ISF1]MDT8912071.1 WXG100 family type VII secretion target [Amycolatopsis sp. PS_44_ISF1]
MSDGTIKYDYEKLDAAFQELTKISNFIETTLDEQRSNVQKIMADWHGSTAEAYNSLCSDLDGDMKSNLETLGMLKNAAHEGSQRMQEADAKGGKQVPR